MRYELTIAARYLWMARKRRHTAFLSIISTLGLAVGVATLLISLALLSGLQGKIKSRLAAQTPQVIVEPTGTIGIAEYERIASDARAAGAVRVEGIVGGFAWGTDEEGKRGRPIRLRSFTAASRPAQLPPDSKGREREIILTRDAAAALDLVVGDSVVVVSPRTRLTPFGPVPYSRKFLLTAVVPLSSDQNAPSGYLPFEEAARLFGTSAEPTSIEIFSPEERTTTIEQSLRGRHPSLLVRDWMTLNKPLFLALRLEKIVMFATISLVIVVAALNLVSSLSMLIAEKRPHVGILRTLGASERSILMIFLFVGLLIGLLGTVLGNVIGIGLSWASNRFELIPLPSDVYYVSYLPFSLDLPEVVLVNVIAVLLSILATWYPARIAARLDPIQAIREE